MSDEYDEFREYVWHYQRKHHLKQYELAEKAGYCRGALYNFMCGSTSHFALAKNLADFMNVGLLYRNEKIKVVEDEKE